MTYKTKGVNKMKNVIDVLNIIALDCNKAVNDFMISTNINEKIISASKVVGYNNLISEIEKEFNTKGSHSSVFIMGGINHTEFDRALDYIDYIKKEN